MKGWIESIEKRQWWTITLAVSNLIGVVATLVMIVFKMLPALAHPEMLPK